MLGANECECARSTRASAVAPRRLSGASRGRMRTADAVVATPACPGERARAAQCALTMGMMTHIVTNLIEENSDSMQDTTDWNPNGCGKGGCGQPEELEICDLAGQRLGSLLMSASFLVAALEEAAARRALASRAHRASAGCAHRRLTSGTALWRVRIQPRRRHRA